MKCKFIYLETEEVGNSIGLRDVSVKYRVEIYHPFDGTYSPVDFGNIGRYYVDYNTYLCAVAIHQRISKI